MQINLLPAPSLTKRLRHWTAMGLVAVLLAMNALLVFFWAGAHMLMQQQNDALVKAQREIRQLQPAYEEQNRLMTLSKQYEVLTEWANSRPPVRTDLELLASLLPSRGYITNVELLDERTYWIRAMLPDMAAVASYMYAAERQREIAQVKALGVERKEAGIQLEMQTTMDREP